MAGTGNGVTVAVYEDGDDPNIVSSLTAWQSSGSDQSPYYLDSDMAYFSSFYGLPQFADSTGQPGPAGTTLPVLIKVNYAGQANYDNSGGDDTEFAMDVETVHAIAPYANILIVEDSDFNFTQQAYLTAETFDSVPGMAVPSVVSSSFGGPPVPTSFKEERTPPRS